MLHPDQQWQLAKHMQACCKTPIWIRLPNRQQFSSFFNRVSEVVKPGDSSNRAEARSEE